MDKDRAKMLASARRQLKRARRFSLHAYSKRYWGAREAGGLKKGRIARVFSGILEEGAMNGIIRTEALRNQWDPRNGNQVKLLRLATDGMFENAPFWSSGLRHDYHELHARYRELVELDFSGTGGGAAEEEERLSRYRRVLRPDQGSLIPLLARLCAIPALLCMSPSELADFLNQLDETDFALRRMRGPALRDAARMTREEANVFQRSLLLPAFRIYEPVAEFLGFVNIREQIGMARQLAQNSAIRKFRETGWFDSDGMDWYCDSNNPTMQACESVLETGRKVAEKMGIKIVIVQGPRSKSFSGIMEKYARRNSKRSAQGFLDTTDDGVGARIVVENITHAELRRFARRLMKWLRFLHPGTKILPKQKLRGKWAGKSGYRGYHIIIRPKSEDIWRFELQIRTMRMHRKAETGEASHAAYKSGTVLPLRLLRRYRELMELGAV